ncbi:MAG: hypothetical protein RL112_1809, partial [Planctomycetota bacterium]
MEGTSHLDPVPTSPATLAWRRAKDHADLCLLAEEFLAGRLASFPGWGASETDAETDALLGALVAACRAGFLPLASQQGGARRRAFVLGFAPPRLAKSLARDAARRGLACVVHGPGAGRRARGVRRA